jgi:hypothetical protein
MPVDSYLDVAGLVCQICWASPATHFYPYPRAICCGCHTGDGEGIVPRHIAIEEHKAILDTQADAPRLPKGGGTDQHGR